MSAAYTFSHGAARAAKAESFFSIAIWLSAPRLLREDDPSHRHALPIRVELTSLNEDDFRRILVDTEASLIKQCEALMRTQGEFVEKNIGDLARNADLSPFIL